MSKPRRTGATPAVTAVVAAGVWHRLHEYRHDPAVGSYGLEAAEALEVDPARVLKTLLVELEGAGRGSGSFAVGILPVDRQLDLKAMAAELGGKRATLASPAVAERVSGYIVGGISPIGQRQRLRTVIDDSASQHPSIFVSAGRRGFDVELTPADLAALTGAEFATVARP